MVTATTETPTLIRIGALARLTGVPVTHLRRLADAGLLPTCRVGPGFHRRFVRDESVRRVCQLMHLLT